MFSICQHAIVFRRCLASTAFHPAGLQVRFLPGRFRVKSKTDLALCFSPDHRFRPTNTRCDHSARRQPRIRRTTITGDTASFTYDTLGNLLTANNANAQITRTYFRNGALQTETQALSTDFLPAHDFTQHIYVQQFRYDLDGRRVWAKHPTQLSPGTDTVAYTYDPVFGALASLTDPLNNRYVFTLDSLGRPTRIGRYPVGQDSVIQTMAFDADGRMTSLVAKTSGAVVVSEGIGYDGAGRVTSSVDTGRGIANASYNDQFTYSGMGALLQGQTPGGTENYTADALGNRLHYDPGVGVTADDYHYEAGTAFMTFRQERRQIVPRSTGKDTTFYSYSGFGELITSEHRHYWLATLNLSPAGTEHEYTTSVYDVQHRLAQTTYRQDSAPPLRQNYSDYFSTETYRYDALGRRVYARAVRGVDCAHHDAGSGCHSVLTRTVWDGDQALYDIRLPGDSAANLEDDAPQADSSHGVIGYLHGGGLDQPLALWKGGTEVVYPYPGHSGVYLAGSCPTATCNLAYFPATAWSSFGDPPVYHYGPPFWHGSLVAGGGDASGYQYKRNRYYDPSTGRFTQEDPIGLAGGLNLYGFAGGDPVNYADPFGLFECEQRGNCTQSQGGQQEALASEECPLPCGGVTYAGVSFSFAAGHGGGVAFGVYDSPAGNGLYFRSSELDGVAVSAQLEEGGGTYGAVKGQSSGLCAGGGPVGGVTYCRASNAHGVTETMSAGVGLTPVNFTQETSTMHLSKPGHPSKGFDCSKPQPQSSVCSR